MAPADPVVGGAEASRHVHPTADDPVVAALSEVVGGPIGSRAGRARWGTPLAVLLLLSALTFAVGMASKSSCAQRDWTTSNVTYSHLCYSDLPASYTAWGLDQLAWPYSADRQVQGRSVAPDQPALVGEWTYLSARITHVLVGSPDLDRRLGVSATKLAERSDVRHEQAVYVAVNAVGLALLALLGTLALTRAAGRRPWDAAGFALAPSLALAGLVSWDLLAVVALACALWAWTRRRPVLVGLAVGLGAAAGVWPALVLPAFAVVAWRRGGRPELARRVLPAAVVALAAWALGNAPAFVSDRSRWEVYWHQALHRPPDLGSVWTIIDQGVGISHGTVTVLSDVLLVVWVVGVLVFASLVAVPPRLSQVAFLLVSGLTMLGAEYRPEQALWLVPLAALARPRWRDLLVWQAGEVFYFAMVWWFLGNDLANGAEGGPAWTYWVAIGVRLVALGWLVGVVARDVVSPADDPRSVERWLETDADLGDYDTTTRSNLVVV